MKKILPVKKILLGSALIFLIIASLLSISLYKSLNAPLVMSEAPTIFLVESGSSFTTNIKKLHKEGLLVNSGFLQFYARLTNRTVIRAGEYSIQQGTTPLQLLTSLNQGDVVRHQLTLIEGRTFRQSLQILSEQKKLQKKLTGLSDSELIKFLGVDNNNLEGLFFPDTYQYTIDMSDVDILRDAHKKLLQVLDEEWQSRDSNLPYKNPYEALIMASIVEKETGVPEERSAIAGVFVRRLQKGMRLQTDPTVIYGLGASYTGNLTRKHLLQDTPYNTYTRSGLPPTPIALSGREAIHAALHPEDGDSLFFVGKGDGHHYFSSTLADHENAVRRFQLTRTKNYHSSPVQVIK